MTKILLVRHGHVEGISPERFRGRADLPLTAGGWRASRRANGSPKTVTRITSICTASRSRWPRPSPSTSTRTSAAIGLCRGRGPRRRSDARPSWCTTHRRSTSRCEAGVFPCRTGKCTGIALPPGKNEPAAISDCAFCPCPPSARRGALGKLSWRAKCLRSASRCRCC